MQKSKLIRIVYISIVGLTLCAATPAFSQYYGTSQPIEPEVVIDTSVLEALNPTNTPPAGHINNKPVQQPFAPTLTKIDEIAPAKATPPRKVLLPELEKTATAPLPHKKPNTSGVISFPVQLKVRSDESDPGLAAATPVTVIPKTQSKKTAIQIPVKNTNTIASSILPLPGEATATVISQTNDQIRLASLPIAYNVPLPKRRPQKQMASQTFVKEARRNITQKKNTKKTIAKPYTPKGQSGPKVAAIPAEQVDKEWLAPPIAPKATKPTQKDPLKEQLLDTDKNSFIKSVEAISKAIMGRNESKNNKTSAAKMAAIKPAAGDIKQDGKAVIDITASPPTAQGKIPRPPPDDSFEEDFVSVPFDPGIDQLDQEIAAALQQKILPTLQQNPKWRLQIQAFASPADNGISSARRVSLSRALSIRTYLMGQGVEARRMDVRALGMQTDRNPADRVDLVVFDPDKI